MTVSWEAAPESDVVAYEVAWGPEEDPTANSRRVAETRVDLGRVPAGWVVAVRAWNGAGLHGRDWARTAVGR